MRNEEAKEKKNGWGGARDGAGRPKMGGVIRTFGLRMPEELWAILDAQPNKSAFIVEAIREYVRNH